MKDHTCRGHTLAELLVAMGLAALVGTIILPAVFTLQARGLAEVSRNDLHARALRLLRFLCHDLRDAAFLVGASPTRSSGGAPVLVHDSLAGNPSVTLANALLIEDGGVDHNDILTLVKAEPFFPPMYLAQVAVSGATSLRLNRRPNQPPGSSREILPSPEAISHVVLANQRCCYPVSAVAQTVQLIDPLAITAPLETEVFGLRVHRFYLDETGRLRCDDFTSAEIIGEAVDGLQFEFLLADGRIVDQLLDARTVCAVRLSLLVHDLRPDQNYLDQKVYRLGNRNYGPYRDRFRRVVVSEMVEVKNYALP